MMHQEILRITLQDTGLIRSLTLAERLVEMQEVADKQAQEVLLSAPTYAEPTPLLTGLEWTLSQRGRKPKLVRLPNWRQRLMETLNRWSDYRYWSGRRCCFMLACAAVDAMCGTRAEATNFSGWDGAGNFWRYIEPKGGRDYFDKWGQRALLGNLKTGDLIQFEERHGLKATFHWAILSDDIGQGIAFEVGGLAQADIASISARPEIAAVRCWSIG